MHDHSQHPREMLNDPPKWQFAPQAHQCLRRMRQQMPIGHLQFLIQGKKPASTVRAGHRRTFHFHLLTSLRLPPPSRPSACLQSLTTLLAHQSLAGLPVGCGTRLRRLFDQLGAQAIHLLIDRLLNLR